MVGKERSDNITLIRGVGATMPIANGWSVLHRTREVRPWGPIIHWQSKETNRTELKFQRRPPSSFVPLVFGEMIYCRHCFRVCKLSTIIIIVIILPRMGLFCFRQPPNKVINVKVFILARRLFITLSRRGGLACQRERGREHPTILYCVVWMLCYFIAGSVYSEGMSGRINSALDNIYFAHGV